MAFTLKELWRKFPNTICLCTPHLRDAETQRVLSWEVEELVDTIDETREALQRLDDQGCAGVVVPISTSDQIIISERLAAKFFREYFGTV